MRRTPRTTRTDTLFTYTTRFRSTDDGLAGVDLIGKRAIVTGTSAGLGVETARCLVAHGAHVVGTARDIAKAEQATAVVRAAAAAGGGRFQLIEMDLASFSSVRAASAVLNEAGQPIAFVTSNAGVLATHATIGSAWWREKGVE